MSERYPIGMKVKTTRSNGSTDWAPGVEAQRRWGVEGEVMHVHDSHGVTYRVMHEDGFEAYYEPGEIIPAERPTLDMSLEEHYNTLDGAE